MNLPNYQLLRLLVLTGLEQSGWVKQRVLTNNSEAFLDYILPKTKRNAAFNLATNIACLDHDQNIQGNRIHLFRLPQSMEAKMNHERIEVEGQDVIIGLAKLASGMAAGTTVGAVNIGAINELQSEEIIQAFAKHYLEAFKRGYKTYPYLK